MLCLLFLLLFACSGRADNSMIIVWGTPNPISNCVKNNDLTWDNCVQNCSSTFLCVIAATDPSGNCFLCNFPNVTDVTETSSEEKWKVAFKVKSDLIPDTCPNSENPPTFDNVPVQMDMSTYSGDAYYRNYTLSFTGSGWKFDYYEKRRCADNYDFFQRTTQEYCLTLLYSDVSYSYDTVLLYMTYCPAGSVFSGVTSAKELEFVMDMAARIRTVAPTDKFYVRLDGKRTTQCQSDPTSEACMTIAGLTTFDKSTLNYDAYTWITDAAAGATEGKQCLVTVFDGVNDGKQDFADCSKETTWPAYAFACGFKAYE